MWIPIIGQLDDVRGAVKFEEGVTKGVYPIDIHDPKGERTRSIFIKDQNPGRVE